MIVRCISLDHDVPPHEANGYSPTRFPDSPIVAVRHALYDHVDRRWGDTGTWEIIHRATGLNLGHKTWPTLQETLAVIERCDPAFPAWTAVRAGVADAALVACRVKFRAAVAATETEVR